MDNIKSETHGVAFFKLYDKPKEFAHGGNYGTQVERKEDFKTVNDKHYYIVYITATQLIENVQALAFINTISEYELIEPMGNVIPKDFWVPLAFKSISECNKMYKEKVKGTYLVDTDIPVPTIEEIGG